jgi:hypothetical protein
MITLKHLKIITSKLQNRCTSIDKTRITKRKG